jgi:O-antigen ligase
MEVARDRRAVIVAAFAGACLLALGFTALALRSLPMAIFGGLGVLFLAMPLVEPFVGLINYLAFLYIRPMDFVPSLQGAPVMLMLGAATAAIVILHKAVRNRALVIAHVPQHFMVIWVYVAVVASRMAMGHVRGAFEATLDFVPTIVMYFLFVELTTTWTRIKVIFLVIAHLTLVLAVQGIVQYFVGAGLGGQESDQGRIQAVGIFADPNDLALTINTALPLTLLIALQSRSVLARLYCALVSCVFVYSIFLTASRGGLLCLGAMAILLLQRKFGKIIGVTAGIMVLVAIIVLGPRMDTLSTEDASSYGRLEAWSLAMDLFKGSPLFGIGYDHYMDYHFRTAHSSYLLCAAELGIFGLYPWLMMFLISYKNATFVEKELMRVGKRTLAIYVHAARVSLIVFFLGALLLSRTYHPLLFIMIALCASISRVFVSTSEDRFALIERRDFALGLALTVGSLMGWEVLLRVLW